MSVRAGSSSVVWDRLGVGASIACTLHCIVGPFLFLAVPTFAEVWAHPASHALIALFVLPLAATVLLRGYRLHRKTWVAACAWVGVACVVGGSVLPFLGTHVAAADAGTGAACCPQLIAGDTGAGFVGIEWPPASIATVIGSCFLVASHIGNLLYCRCCVAPVQA